MLRLSQATLPIKSMVMRWSQSNVQKISILLILSVLFNSIKNREIPSGGLLGVQLSVFTKCLVIKPISNIFKLIQILQPDLLVFLKILKHLGVSHFIVSYILRFVSLSMLEFLIIQLFKSLMLFIKIINHEIEDIVIQMRRSNHVFSYLALILGLSIVFSYRLIK